ncbi:S4 domain-containing protein [Geosporobacter ferrireducens]|uniref:RNA-binding S4 domain-containing protein n=1 Tax=Geosporobacter ferrireducens TaxID=1424294 RepID=A0A1D8GKR5_9FIRM|nr:S4 domain-containing protein [Geosporobacter ferrireducens]AOT71497.1 hypothetical protein Gferi_19355 [Geosporobacter ferrireducens]
MEKVILEWQLIENPEHQKIERYCHNCGKKVAFEDSLKRRKNANGKNIYEYAIYKCENGHTWNHKLAVYKSTAEIEEAAPVQTWQGSKLEILKIGAYRELDVEEIEIVIKQVRGKWRIDKLLGQQVHDLSRSQIEKYIKKGAVLLDGEKVKPSTLLKEQQRISLLLNIFI